MKSLDPYGKYCYIFVADIHCPSKFYDSDFEYPILTDHDIPPNSKTEKLMFTFYEKKNYTISLLMLKYSLQKGLMLKKVHHKKYAEQNTFMKPYIIFNNEKRTECSKNKDKMGDYNYKSMNNNAFRKNSENNQKYKAIRFAITLIKLRK